jgi:hypothetical protein
MSQTRRTEWTVSFNLWTVQGAWFWSLVYPDRHGGVIGAAASEAEAVVEAQAAIDRLPQLRDDAPLALRNDSRFMCQFRRSKASHFNIGSRTAETNELAGLHTWRKRSSKSRTMDESYNSLWQLTLRQYAARVAAA